MGRLLLLRHVESQYGEGAQERSEGWRDIPPSPEGRKQAQEVAGKFKDVPVKEVVSSDLQRNKILGRAIAAETGATFSTSGKLRSMNVGSLAGRLRSENKKTLEYHRQHPDKPFPGGGETFRTYVQRWLVNELPELQEKASKLKGDLAAVTHGHNIQDAYEYLNFKKLDDLPKTGSIWEIENGKMEPWEPEEKVEKVSKTAAGYMKFSGALEDTPCEIVEGMVSKNLACCNLFKKTGEKVFSCGTCEHIGDGDE